MEGLMLMNLAVRPDIALDLYCLPKKEITQKKCMGLTWEMRTWRVMCTPIVSHRGMLHN